MQAAKLGRCHRIPHVSSGGPLRAEVAAISVVAVLVALIVTPTITGRLTAGVHVHIRRVLDPLDDSDGQISELVSRSEASALRYVMTGDRTDLAAYQEHSLQPGAVMSTAGAQAERLNPDACAS